MEVALQIRPMYNQKPKTSAAVEGFYREPAHRELQTENLAMRVLPSTASLQRVDPAIVDNEHLHRCSGGWLKLEPTLLSVSTTVRLYRCRW